MDGEIDDDTDELIDELIDGDIDALAERDSELDGLGDEISVTANVPDALKVCMVLLPLVVMVPPVAVMSAVE